MDVYKGHISGMTRDEGAGQLHQDHAGRDKVGRSAAWLLVMCCWCSWPHQLRARRHPGPCQLVAATCCCGQA
jgi:hypothetical protein